MATSLFTSGLVAALVGADSYGAGGAQATDLPVPPRVRAEIVRARIELYCGHDAEVLAGIRAASRALEQVPGPLHASVLAELGQAAWQTRQKDFHAAGLALERALAVLDGRVPALKG